MLPCFAFCCTRNRRSNRVLSTIGNDSPWRKKRSEYKQLTDSLAEIIGGDKDYGIIDVGSLQVEHLTSLINIIESFNYNYRLDNNNRLWVYRSTLD